MFAFLASLVPRKDYVYGALILVLIIGFGWYTFHERSIGRREVELKDSIFAAAQVTKNKEIENGISKGIKAAVDKWSQIHPTPPASPTPHIVCYDSSSGSSVRKGGGTANPSNGAGTGVSISSKQTDEGFNPSQAVSITGTEADVEIVRLKAKVTLLQDTIKVYQSGGLVDTDKGK